MKRISILVLCAFFAVFSNAQSFNCVQLINTNMSASVNVNSSVQVCFSAISGMFVVALPPFVPPIDTAYITQQDSLGNAYFLTDSCIVFQAFGRTGEATANYTIETPNGCTKSGTLKITINCPAPTAKNDSFSVFSNGANQLLTFGRNDSAVENPATFSIVKNPANGTIISSNDSLWFSGNGSYTGADTIVYVLQNACGATDTASIFLNIVRLTANNDTLVVLQETKTEIWVMENDVTFVNPSVQLCGNPVNGTASVSNDSVIYTGNKNYPSSVMDTFDTAMGLDSLCYVLCASLNGNQACDTAMIYLYVQPQVKFFFPQGFSPNGDGLNDVLEVKNTGYFPNSYLIVYNRYGDEVWRGGPNYQNNFSGTAPNGKELPDGTYFYIYKFNDGTTKDTQGYFVINR